VAVCHSLLSSPWERVGDGVTVQGRGNERGAYLVFRISFGFSRHLLPHTHTSIHTHSLSISLRYRLEERTSIRITSHHTTSSTNIEGQEKKRKFWEAYIVDSDIVKVLDRT
jgi:hypothetical protein